MAWPVREDDIGLTNVEIRQRNIKKFVYSPYFKGEIVYNGDDNLKYNITDRGKDIEIDEFNKDFIVNFS